MKQIRSLILGLVHDKVRVYYIIYNDLPSIQLFDSYWKAIGEWQLE